MIKYKANKAFSLVELSIVILVIGILIAAITKGGDILQTAKLAGAQNLSRSSGVGGMKDLALWLDATNNEGFLENEREYGSLISSWAPANKTISGFEQQPIFTQTNDEFKPIYTKNAINGLPALYFDGGTATDLDGDMLVAQDDSKQIYSDSSGITMFIVAVNREKASTTFIFDFGLMADSGYGMQLRSDGISCYASGGFGGSSVNKNYNTKKPRNFSCRIAFNGKLSMWQNGEILGNSGQITLNKLTAAEITTALKMTIGRTAKSDLAIPRYYQGYIGEIIIFTRALTDNELKRVHKYLEQKWG